MIYFDCTEHSLCKGVFCSMCADTISQTALGRWFKDWYTQDRTWKAGSASIIKQRKFHLWYRAGIGNNECTAITDNKTKQQLLAQLWVPVLRAEVHAFLRGNGHRRWSISGHVCFALSIVASITVFAARFPVVDEQDGAARRSDHFLYSLEDAFEHQG